MKVIEPLFLNDLKEDFENARGNNNKLNQLLYRLKNIKIFDPACGSGNFLIIAYKELRRLEMEIFKEMGSLALSEISLNQFYGIELDDFAREIAILALWLTKHQMNVEFFKEFGRTNPTLPLTDAGNIVQGNACRLDWEVVCPKNQNDEVYILGNPPYLGFSQQKSSQKADIKFVWNSSVKIDYISCWFKKGAEYIQSNNCRIGFVSTNSICQGEQVSALWPSILIGNTQICFCHTSFLWTNNAKSNAGVYCIIIGLDNGLIKRKSINTGTSIRKVSFINPYLTTSNCGYVHKRASVLSDLPKMTLGDMAKDGGFLFLTSEEKEGILRSNPKAHRFIRKLIGAKEFLSGSEKWCLWINDNQVDEAIKIPFIESRLENVKLSRLASTKSATQKFAKLPHRFVEIRYKEVPKLLIPTVTSSRRNYIPIGFFDDSVVLNAPNNVINDPAPYIFSLIHSTIHMSWVRAIGGRLKTDYRYSATLCYNTFPFPSISKQRKEELTQCTLNIIDERLKYSEKTMAQLYDPDKMPEGLRQAHYQNDLAIERCYRSTPFSNDEERLEYLFKLYEKMIQEEKDKDTLFAKQKKKRKRK